MENENGLVRAEASELALEPLELPPDRNPYWVYLGKFASENSRSTMAQALRIAAGVLKGSPPYGGGPLLETVDASRVSWHRLRYQHVEWLKAVLLRHHKPSTVNKILSAVRQVLIRCRRLGLMTSDECAAAIDVENVKFELVPAGRRAEDEEIQEKLLGSMPADRAIECRNRAVVGLSYFAGLRRSEIASLTMDRYLRSARQLKALGKGRKERVVAVVEPLWELLEQWLSVRGVSPGPLICSVHHGLDPTQSISSQTIYDIVADAAQSAGLAHLSPHDMRRSFISNGIDAGVDVLVMSKAVGHEQVQTTLRYDRRGEKTQREQLDKAFPGKK